MKRVVDWIVTVPFLMLFGLALLVFDIVGRLARLFGIRPFEYVMAALQRTLMWVFRVAGTRWEIERDSEIQTHQGYVIISNHQSMIDIVLIGGLLFTNFPKYVAKKELGRWIPSISLNLRWGGNAVIDRQDRRQALRAIGQMASEAQERNVSVVIFPEGTRSRDGRLGEFKEAGARHLLKGASQLPVVTAAVDGAWKLGNMVPIPFGTRVRIRFGRPIPRQEGEDFTELVARARQEIADTIEAWRGLPAEA
jgi:1-acyl-sn-glycerol-3-phosphate acyltransferase